ncbi:MAG: SCP2 sterol-binding domain-containing protein [Methylobacteriaceae bacterium]|jgi:predicted lipid carrier protein YhbT|nr:SCP2 sterol-binding domain-containing protein [Methylobacteriaceae bacterium]
MESSRSSVPTIPGFLGKVMKPLPLAPLQPLLAMCIRAALKKHPRIFDRLDTYADKRFGLNPTDLPFAFVLEPRRQNASAQAVRELPDGLDVKITGPFFALMGLADGYYDGDALFFSRDLTVEGDMEAVVALRNALDDAKIDFPELFAANLGPFAPAAEKATRAALELLRGRRENPTYTREEKSWN